MPTFPAGIPVWQGHPRQHRHNPDVGIVGVPAAARLDGGLRAEGADAAYGTPDVPSVLQERQARTDLAGWVRLTQAGRLVVQMRETRARAVSPSGVVRVQHLVGAIVAAG